VIFEVVERSMCGSEYCTILINSLVTRHRPTKCHDRHGHSDEIIWQNIYKIRRLRRQPDENFGHVMAKLGG
jgi:hypothetical protein